MMRAHLIPLLLAFVVLLAGCSVSLGGDPVVDADEVESGAQQEFSQQFPVDSVDCPDDLPAEVGAEIKCVLVSEGKSFEMTTTVTAVDGEDVNYSFELTDEL